jgi:hydrogenase maturation protein HypF
MAAGALTQSPVRTRLRVEGTVQGVGFRPYVYRLAHELALAGFVRNDARGVVIEVEGEQPLIDELARRLKAEAPPLASIERVEIEPLVPTGARGFQILESDAQGVPAAPVTADSATC